MPHVEQHAVNAVQQKPVVSLHSLSCCESTCCSPAQIHGSTYKTCVRLWRIFHHLATIQMCPVIISDQYHQDKPLQHEMTPPTGLQNNRTDTAAVSCVVKHEACSNGRRISKQTGPSCRDRCSHSESGLTCNWSKRFTYSTRHNHRQDCGSPRRPTAGDQQL